MPIGKSSKFGPYLPPPITPTETKMMKEFPDIFGSLKSVKTGAPKIDEMIDCLEEGINIIFGEWGTLKTTLSLQILMNALEQGMSVRFIDTELGVHSKRLTQMYKAGGYSFPTEKLLKAFIRLPNWGWQTLRNRWLNVLEYETPDVFVVDSITPVFLDTFFKEDEKKHFETLQSRDTLATTTLQLCSDKHVIVILTGHEKAPLASGKVSELLEKEAVEFSGLGRRFAYLAKTWLYLFKETEKESDVEKTKRFLALLKHRYMPTYSETGKCVEIKATERGVET